MKRQAHIPDPRPRDTLTSRERQVIALVSDGFTNRAIGSRMGIAEGTVKRHLHRIFDKTGAGSRAELVAMVLTRQSDSEAMRGVLELMRGQFAALQRCCDLALAQIDARLAK